MNSISTQIKIGAYQFPLGFELASSIALSFNFWNSFRKMFSIKISTEYDSHSQQVIPLTETLQCLFTDFSNPLPVSQFHDYDETTFSSKFEIFSKLYSWNPFFRLFLGTTLESVNFGHSDNFTFVYLEPLLNTLPKTSSTVGSKFKLLSFIIWQEFHFKLVLYSSETLFLIQNSVSAKKLNFKISDLQNYGSFFLVSASYQYAPAHVIYSLQNIAPLDRILEYPHYDSILKEYLQPFNIRTLEGTQKFFAMIRDPNVFAIFHPNDNISSIIFQHIRLVCWASELIHTDNDDAQWEISLKNLFSSLPTDPKSFEGRFCRRFTLFKCRILGKDEGKQSFVSSILDPPQEVSRAVFFGAPYLRRPYFDKFSFRLIAQKVEDFANLNEFQGFQEEFVFNESCLNAAFQSDIRYHIWPAALASKAISVSRK